MAKENRNLGSRTNSDGNSHLNLGPQTLILGKWYPAAGFDALLRGYQQPDFQLYQ